MKKGVVVAAVAVIVLVGAAAAAVPLTETYVASQIKSQMDKDGGVSAAKVEVGLFDRRLVFRDLKSRKSGTEFAATRWEATGLNWPLDELVKGNTPFTGFKVGDPLQARRIEVDDMRISPSGGDTIGFRSVVLEGVTLDRFEVPRGAAVPADQNSAQGARLLNALAVDRFEMKDVISKGQTTGNTVGFQQLGGARLDRGRLGDLTLVNMEATSSGGAAPAFKLEDMKMGGFDVRAVLKAMSDPSWQIGMPVGRVSVENASARGFSGELLDRYGISLGSVTVDFAHEGTGVTRSSTRIDGFVMVPPSRGLEGMQMRMVMGAMSLKELKLALDCKGTEDRTKNELTIDRCALTGPDLGELNLTGRLVNADPAFWQAMDKGTPLEAAGSSVALGEAKLVFADKSLLERAIAATAMVSGSTPAKTRLNMAEQVRRYQPPDVLITDDMTKLLETVARFIEKGGNLTVEARPDPPFGLDKLGYLQQPGPDLVNVLGITASLTP
jgi:hypothetical protein